MIGRIDRRVGDASVSTSTSSTDEPLAVPGTLTRRLLGWELVIVLALSLGKSGVDALISFVGDLTAPQKLSSQTAELNGSFAPGRPWLDLTWQLFSIAVPLAAVALVGYLLLREGSSLRVLGFDLSRGWLDLGRGFLIAACIGGSGLALYLGAHAAGVNLTVVPSSLPDVWWRIPVLLLSAAQNAVVEEVIVVGYLLRRLDQLGWSWPAAVAASALLRGSYHLYQGAGGFAGNVVMGVVFCLLYRRWRRVAPLAIAHTLIDSVAFVGYVLLVGHVSWLPTP
jgi:membrane protease YdiL (CAAX protease family)